MPGPPPKPAHLSARNRPRRASRVLAVVPAEPSDFPKPPAGLLKQNRDDWSELWKAPIAQTFDLRTDLSSLRRLFQYRDERDRLWIEMDSAPTTVGGSHGGTRRHPGYDVINMLEGRIVALEDRFGLNLQGRLRQGVTFMDAEERVARRRSDDSDEAQIDPRAANPAPG